MDARVLPGLLLLTLVTGGAGQQCKYPNEGCHDDGECCSERCVRAHPGTNPRCTKLKLYQKCLYTYQCDDPLECGSNKTCCARYWNMCHEREDCCDRGHDCYEVEGFYYKRCLFPADGSLTSDRDPATSMTSALMTSHSSVSLAVKLSLPVLLTYLTMD